MPLDQLLQEYCAGHAGAIAELLTAELVLEIFCSTAYLASEHEKHSERDAWVKSDPAYKKLSLTVIAAKRAVVRMEDQIRAADLATRRQPIRALAAAE